MLTNERRKKILDLINLKKNISVIELMKLLNTSNSTIQRDLNHMHQQKLIQKVHGGAICLDSIIQTQDINIDKRLNINVDEKKLIAKFAASLIKDNDVVYIDAGSTTFLMIDYIENVKATFITNCIAHASKLLSLGYKVYLPSGILKKSTQALIGVDTYKYLKDKNFTIGFFGTNAVSIDKGYSTPDPDEGLIKQIAFEKSNEKYILVDSSKYDKVCTFTFASIDNGLIITNSDIPKIYNNLHNTIIVDQLKK